MNNYKYRIILICLGIVVCSLVMIVSTYAYFTVKINGEGEDISLKTFSDNTTIIFTDTSNVTLVNAYTGDSIDKVFSIENTSDYSIYYDVVLSNVVNNFENNDDLIYTIESNNVAFRQGIVPKNDEELLSYVLIKPHEKHNYNMSITFINSDNNQNANMGKTFSSNISISPSKNINVGQMIYEEGSLLKEIVTASDGIKSGAQEGVFQTNNSTFGTTIYYYSGTNNLNNNLVYNNMCFKILRTDDNNNIRIIYNGRYIDESCEDNRSIDNGVYNTKSNSNAYVGYMYGTPSSNSYLLEHKNVSSSTIKTIIDKWFDDNFTDKEKITNDTYYCNNRKTYEFINKNVVYSKLGYSTNNTGYYSMKNDRVSYECENVSDRFSVDSNVGNNSLNYSVGLPSIEDIKMSESNNQSFLKTNIQFWTMSPAYFSGNEAYVYTSDGINHMIKKVNEESAIRPVITLNKNVKIKSGIGTIEEPYFIE